MMRYEGGTGGDGIGSRILAERGERTGKDNPREPTRLSVHRHESRSRWGGGVCVTVSVTRRDETRVVEGEKSRSRGRNVYYRRTQESGK